MRDQLLNYYERELGFLRQMGAGFAEKYPKIAGRLLLEPDKCEDPHVERMIEAFAFLAGRVHLKIDDEFPEITESLLNVLYPHYLAPIPSMSIAQFSLDQQQGNLTSGYTIDRGTVLYSRPIQGTPCRFRTCYPVTIWPIEISAASLSSADPVDSKGKWTRAVLRIRLRCLNNTRLSNLRLGEDQSTLIENLRFYINGEPQLVYPLYEMIFNNATAVELVPSAEKKANGVAQRTSMPITLPINSLKVVGFDSDEGMLPFTARSFSAYRLLTEYFAFPEKFLFFDITAIDAAARAGFGEEFEILIHLRDVVPPPSTVDKATFQVGCAPIVNLFDKIAEPIHLNHLTSEYRVIPDIHRQMATEIYSIDSVTTVEPYLQESQEFQPFYSLRHAYDREQERTFWYATRRPSLRIEDSGTEVYLSLVDMGFNPNVPAVETMVVHTTCTNRDLPGRLPFGDRAGDFDVESAAPLARIRALKNPTATLRPPMRHAAHWRLISHLSLNHLSIVGSENEGNPEALREILLLYNFMDSSATRKQIAGIEKVASRRVVRQTGSRIGSGFVRGIETTIEFDEEQYVGSGIFLFASVLERFLGLYSSVNSFNQLVAKVKQREGNLKRWPPRAGQQWIL
ncbi:MAG TPA: type VI secretion system baseplate subunit TssF [Blastocatellia bacterium]|nr:type VI secretion system baseplate subunit TssF [Blastocatellia bacterium]